ncbi:MarR family winged helix-turn-helix transcriptional regulator [Desulfovibrio sp. TomC]|uniref:MarR family winged helix-turn-helix transcriptional regulator n=1 Tax=Desulfovibrio sp. TomC TaxID=1562888 RepID=UPI00057495AB|nr:MarR family transcriptional regulator [Desulfovibrio sp. TomC]KHK03686.1 Transcriptional regulator, MarR family [Desulfovibrio sp. TomC]
MDASTFYDIDRAIGYTVGHAAARIKMALRRAFAAAGHDVTPEQWIVLYRLCETTGMTQVGLGERTVKDKTSITRILDRLETRGLISRRRDARDRRSQRLFPTPEGEDVVRALAPVVRNFAAIAYADLTDEEATILRRILARIEARLDAMPEPKDEP